MKYRVMKYESRDCTTPSMRDKKQNQFNMPVFKKEKGLKFIYNGALNVVFYPLTH